VGAFLPINPSKFLQGKELGIRNNQTQDLSLNISSSLCRLILGLLALISSIIIFRGFLLIIPITLPFHIKVKSRILSRLMWQGLLWINKS